MDRAQESVDSALDALIARTAGPQPWRKIFHAFNAGALALFASVADPPQALLLGGLGAIVVLLLVGDFVRLRHARTNELFFRAFSALASPREARGIASSTWYAIGLLAAFMLFPRDVAVSSVLVMGFADPLGGYVGRRFGRRPFLGGTVAGSVTFVVVAATVLLIRHEAFAALPAAALCAIAERRSWPLDDNLAIPLTCGAVLSALSWIG